MSIVEIQAPHADRPVRVRVTDPTFPQSVTGTVWRYNANKTFDVQAGQFGTSAPEVVLGAPLDLSSKLFLIEGVVIAMGDDPPSPFEVVVEFLQGEVIHRQVPDGARGSLGNKSVAFLYRFQIVTV